MKVCIITSPIYPVPAVKGGAVEQLIETLVKENEKFQWIDLTVVSSYDKKAEEKSKKYQHTKFLYIPYGSKVDLLQEKKAFIYINRMWMKLKGIPLLSQKYSENAIKMAGSDSFDAYIVEGGGDPYNYRYLVKAIPHEKLWVHDHSTFEGDKAYRRMFSKFICVSNSTARLLVMNGIINKKDVKVLPNCVDMDLFLEREEYNRIKIRSSLGFDENDFIFIYWGRLIPEKGVLELVEAFIEIQKKHKNAKLMIIGNPKFALDTSSGYLNELHGVINEENLQNSIKFTGFVPHEEMWKYIKAADIAVIPSIWNEPAPLVVYEAFASEIPLITTRNGGIPELANNSNAVVLDWTTEFVDTLIRAMEYSYHHLAEMNERASRAYKDIQNYSEENYYKNFVNIIKWFLDDDAKGVAK